MDKENFDFDKIIKGLEMECHETVDWINNFLNDSDIIEVISQCMTTFNIIKEDEISNQYTEFPSLQFLLGMALTKKNLDGIYDNEKTGILVEKLVEYFKKYILTLINTKPNKNKLDDLIYASKNQAIILQQNPQFYNHQTKHYIKNVFEPFSLGFKSLFGFPPLLLLEVGKEIEESYMSKFKGRLELGMKKRKEIENEYWKDTSFKNIIDDFLSENKIKLNDFLDQEISNSSFLNLKEIFLFKPNILFDDFSEDKQKELMAMLKSLSCKFGDNDSFTNPLDKNIILKKPFIKVGEFYLMPLIRQYLHFSPSILEGLLDGEKEKKSKFWDNFQKNKANFLVNSGVEYLKRVFPGESIFKEVKYNIDGVNYESDIVISFKEKLFLFEAKSGSLTAPAKRGAPKRLETDLKKLIGDSFRQASRLKTSLKNKGSIDLYDNKKNIVKNLRLENYTEIFVCCLNTEPLMKLASNIKELDILGIFPDDEGYPWAINLYDLDIITQILNKPSFFYHYIKSRLSIIPKNLWHTFDELSFLGWYLDYGNFYTPLMEDKKVPDFISIAPDFLEPFDLHFLRGKEMPGLKIEKEFLELIESLEKLNQPGLLDFTSELLDCDRRSRREIIKQLNNRVSACTMGQDYSSCTIPYTTHEKVKSGITIIALKKRDELSKRLYFLSYLKKYQTKSFKWIGLGIDNSDKYFLINEFIMLKHEWEYDEYMEKLCIEHLKKIPN